MVRYGIRRANDPIVVDSLKVVDRILKVDTPMGPCWHRYNHDGYGQKEDGGPYQGWGRGRAWPLLTGERGHYEIAAGRDPTPYILAMEHLASPGRLLPEQVWDEPDRSEVHMYFGKPTGAAMPLMWAHAEYVKLLRSAHDGRVFDLIPEVAKRYIEDRSRCRRLEIWKQNRRISTMRSDYTLRIQASRAFVLHWSLDGWHTATDTTSSPISLGIEYVDIECGGYRGRSVSFTFLWVESNSWEGRDYKVSFV